MNKLINIIDRTEHTLTAIKNKIDSRLQQHKKNIAEKYFKDNQYIQDYIKHFYDSFKDSFFKNEMLCRYNDFDFTQIPETLKENFIEYMQDNHGLYYHSDDYYEGFTIDSFDNIYISDENEIFADFARYSVKYTTDLDLFLKIELMQAKNGIYPVVYLDYYGQYKRDYNIPNEYRFLETAMHYKEDRLIHFINKLIELNNDTCTGGYYYLDNFIVEQFTPEVIKKINNNLSIDINEVSLDDDFTLHIEFEIPTKLKESDLEKLNITNYHYTKYDNTIININTNIKSWLESELQRGYSFEDMRTAAWI